MNTDSLHCACCFLDAITHLYERFCPFVGQSVPIFFLEFCAMPIWEHNTDITSIQLPPIHALPDVHMVHVHRAPRLEGSAPEAMEKNMSKNKKSLVHQASQKLNALVLPPVTLKKLVKWRLGEVDTTNERIQTAGAKYRRTKENCHENVNGKTWRVKPR